MTQYEFDIVREKANNKWRLIELWRIRRLKRMEKILKIYSTNQEVEVIPLGPPVYRIDMGFFEFKYGGAIEKKRYRMDKIKRLFKDL